jgi:hypothetical protein
MTGNSPQKLKQTMTIIKETKTNIKDINMTGHMQVVLK